MGGGPGRFFVINRHFKSMTSIIFHLLECKHINTLAVAISLVKNTLSSYQYT